MVMQLSDRAERLQPSATMAISQKARERKAAGHPVISLSAGEPDFDTPDHVKEAAKEAIDRGETKYTTVDGIPELKTAIIAKFERDQGFAATPEQIVVSPGGKAVLYNLFAAVLEPGKRVLIPAPYWVSYPDMVGLCGAEPVILATTQESAFKLSAEQLRAHIRAHGEPDWLVLNSPSNPTGAVYSRSELEALAEVLRDHRAINVVCDDIYEHLVYSEEGFLSLITVAPDLAERIVVMNGASKAYAMTGWRIGYCAAPRHVARAMAKIMGQTTSNACSISQWATHAALTGDHGFLAEWRTRYRKRRDTLMQAISDAPGLNAVTPDGAFYIFASCAEVLGKRYQGEGDRISDDMGFCAALLEHADVAVVPGTAFGAPDHFRMSYAASDTDVADAGERIKEFCSHLK